MGRAILVVFILIVSLNVASAIEYECSDGSALDSTVREIDVGARRGINGLSLAVVRADETVAINRITADIITEAKILTFSNQSPTEEVTFSGTDYDVTLEDANLNSATIEVDGSSEEIDVEDSGVVNGLEIYVKSAQGDNTSNMEAEIIIGSKYLTLTNDGTEFSTYNGETTSYLIELVSASDNGATLEVSICDTNEFVQLAEEPEPPPEPDPVENDTEVNNTELNDTDDDNGNVLGCANEGEFCGGVAGVVCCGEENGELECDILDETVVDGGGLCIVPSAGDNGDKDRDRNLNLYYWIAGGVILLVILAIIIRSLRSKHDSNVEDQTVIKFRGGDKSAF